jgi:ABC-type uncharacterized transport system auxiliary subunit
MIRRMLLLAALALIPLGCLSKSYPERQRFVLDAGRSELPAVEAAAAAQAVKGRSQEPGAGSLRVGQIRVSPLFERKRFVYRTGESTLEEDFYNEFYAPPAQILREATFDWMSTSPLFQVVVEDAPYAAADWLLEGRVERLYADLRSEIAPQSVMVIEFSLLRTRTNEAAFSKRYVAATEIPRRDPSSVVSGWNESLARILSEFEADMVELSLR